LVAVKSPSITHPVSTATVPRSPLPGVVTARERRRRPVEASIAIAKPSRPPACAKSAGSRVARKTRAPNRATASRRGRAKVERIRRATGASGRRALSVARVASSRWPYGTPDGQAVSQARQPRQRSMCVCTASSSGDRRPSTTSRISTMRPRGLSFSSCRLTYVGHACRQKPQCTHRSIPPRAWASGVPGIAHGRGSSVVETATAMPVE
jgi:hypothetical protein